MRIFVLLLSCLSCAAQFADYTDQPFVSGLPDVGVPQTIAGLQLWVKPETLSGTNGQVLTTWADSSGNGWNANDTVGSNGPTLTNAVLGSYSGIYFGAANNNKRLTVTNQGALSIFSGKDGCTLFSVVKKNANSASDQYWFDTQHSASFPILGLEQNSVGNTHYFYSNKGDGGGFKSCGSMPSGFNILTYRVQWTNVTLSYHINGASTNTITLPGSGQQSATNWISEITLGRYGGGQYSLDGWLVEMIVYSTVLSTSNRAVVESYLKT